MRDKLTKYLHREIVMYSYYTLAKIMAAHPNRSIRGSYRRLYYRGLMPHKL